MSSGARRALSRLRYVGPDLQAVRVAADVRGDLQTASEPPILRDMKWPMKHLWVLPLTETEKD
jgi:hypothetical protein